MKLRLQAKYSLSMLLLVLTIIIVLSVSLLNQFRLSVEETGRASSHAMQQAILDQLQGRARVLTVFLAENLVNPMYDDDVESIYELLRSARQQRDVIYAYVYDSDGTIIHDGIESIPAYGKLFDDEISKQAVISENLLIQLSDNHIDVSMPIRIYDTRLGGVRIGLSMAAMKSEIDASNHSLQLLRDAGVKRSIQTILLISLLLIILGVAAALFVARGLVRPIKRLKEGAAAIGSGEYGAEIDVQRQDEIGELAVSLHKMGVNLQLTTISKDYLNNIITSMKDALLVTHGDGLIERVNPALCTMLNFSESDLIGCPISTILPKQTGIDSAVVNGDTEFIARNGEEIPVSLSVASMSGNSVVRHVYVAQDIRDRKEAERRQQLADIVFQHTADGVIITDHQGYIEYINPAFERIVGLQTGDVIGKPLPELMTGELADSFFRDIWKSLYHDGSWKGEVTSKRRDGVSFDVDITASALRDPLNNLIAHVAVLRDISEEKLLQAKMEHTQRLESLGILAGGIAHDFNNLLSTILANASMAKKNLAMEPLSHGYFERIESASHRAAELCKQMLAYSGKGSFTVEPVNLSNMVFEIVQLLEVSLGKSVTMNLKLDDTLPPIQGDAGQLQQVFMNLVTNASESIGATEGQVSVETGVMDVDADYLSDCYHDGLSAGRYLFAKVEDNGAGMDRETMAKIFDPFFTTKFTGRGLGMSAVLGIVRGHHGALKLDSETGEGSCFTVLLPYPSEVENNIVVTASPLVEDEQTHTGTVLVVDDEELLRLTLEMMLEDMGFDVIAVENGMEAVAAYQQRKEEICLVVLDLTMPKMDGLTCLKQLQAMNDEVKVILASGYSEEQSMDQIAEDQWVTFLQKPFTPKLLEQKIHQLTDAEQ